MKEMPSQEDQTIDTRKPSESLFATILGYRTKPWVLWALSALHLVFLVWAVSSIKATEFRLEAQGERITRLQILIDTLSDRPDFNQQVDGLTNRVGRMERALEEMTISLKLQKESPPPSPMTP